jgi:hypothetical protein
MARLPRRRPSAPRPYGMGAVAPGWTRRREARAPRVTVRDAFGQPRTLAADDPRSEAILGAAEQLLLAAQRASDA